MLRWAATHAPMLERLMGCERLLEVGTGTGMLSALLSKWTSLTVSIDIDASVMSTARRFQESIGACAPMVQGDTFQLPFPDGAFDAVFSQGLLEHFSDAQVRAMVGEQTRVSRQVLASVPSCFYPHVGRRGPGLVGNERLLTACRWEQILDGFIVEANYYSDIKVATVAGWTLPWPNQILLVITADSGR